MSIADRIKEARKAKHMTQSELAEKAGIASSKPVYRQPMT